MPPKSRKNRRNIPQSRNPAAAPQTRPASQPAASSPAAATPARPSFAASPARPTPAALASTHILGELKWISLVTIFIVIVLILAYTFLPK